MIKAVAEKSMMKNEKSMMKKKKKRNQGNSIYFICSNHSPIGSKKESKH
jgi:hemolysin-activating ACP:hemolysin acyltransferase